MKWKNGYAKAYPEANFRMMNTRFSLKQDSLSNSYCTERNCRYQCNGFIKLAHTTNSDDHGGEHLPTSTKSMSSGMHSAQVDKT